MKTKAERKNFATRMRRHPTRAEWLLNEELSWLREHSDFYRREMQYVQQALKGHYILDFYFPKSRLAVEVDGPSHNAAKQKEYDKERTERLNSFGIKILRFTNEAAEKNAIAISDEIRREVVKRFKPEKKKMPHYTRMTPGRGPVVVQR